MNRMHNPPHPGLTLRDDVLPELGLSVTRTAEHLGVLRVTLSNILNGRDAISPDLTLRIEVWLGVDREGEARVGLAKPSTYDRWQAQLRSNAKPMRVQPAPAMAV